jgi:hypothetical protein
MSRRNGGPPDRPARTVHARMVWSGVVLAVAGTIAIGAGIIVPLLVVSVAGVVLLAIGTFLGAKGGGLYDARPEFEAHEDIKDALHGREHQGVAPGDMVEDDEVRRDAARTTAVVERTESRRPAAHEEMATPMGVLMLLVAAALLVAQGTLTAHTPNGMMVSLNLTYIAIVLGLVGFRIATVPGPHQIAVTVAIVAGLGLVLQGAIDRTAGYSTDRAAIVAIQVICGVVIVLAALTALGSPRAKPEKEHAATRH